MEVVAKIILKIKTDKAGGIGDLSEEEKIKLILVEMELNDRVCREFFKKYGISIRVHLL